ncbi:T9SS type A sorting domain-containing protein [Dyadobacter sp. MSC1_007]|jgi:hypothetical protein|uniref:T9SS type A sorting domain-containing protein n=1 Tax=Dyadobacter sp. MSC1_007 TaxID=2909264 RepID=UPI00202DFA89|nr:T9SS type A sorting domain-containing protein [Dyadobacter sp. MSC1_007]
MKRLIFTVTTIALCAYHTHAQQISPGALYAASGLGSGNGVSVNWVLGSLNTFSDISALPVRLISFEGKLNAADLAELHWKTAEEVNNLGFEIQKSPDGKAWDLIGWVDGAVNSQKEHSYKFIDQDFNTTSYYRLRQVDMDDSFTYSKIVSVIPEKESLERLYVYPNPSHESKLKVRTPEKTVKLFIYDAMGRLVSELDQPATEETISLPYKGVFTIGIETPVGNKAVKLVYQ